MKFKWKKWGIIFASSFIGTISYSLTPWLPILGPVLTMTAVIGGAVYATMLELKEEQEVNEKEHKMANRRKVEPKQAEDFGVLTRIAETIQVKEVEGKVKEIEIIANRTYEAAKHLEPEELHDMQSVLLEDVLKLLHSYALFNIEEREEKKEEMLEILQIVQEKIEAFESKVNHRKEKNFQLTKVFIQEKLKRY